MYSTMFTRSRRGVPALAFRLHLVVTDESTDCVLDGPHDGVRLPLRVACTSGNDGWPSTGIRHIPARHRLTLGEAPIGVDAKHLDHVDSINACRTGYHSAFLDLSLTLCLRSPVLGVAFAALGPALRLHLLVAERGSHRLLDRPASLCSNKPLGSVVGEHRQANWYSRGQGLARRAQPPDPSVYLPASGFRRSWWARCLSS